MRIYNSATHKKEEFQPIESGKVRMYVCGPTVYDNIHIGNARTFISFDVIRRWLIASGYEVTFAQNLTDVDDKIIKRANEQAARPPRSRRSSPTSSLASCALPTCSIPMCVPAPPRRSAP